MQTDLITDRGRAMMAQWLAGGLSGNGLTHLAIGDGDATFTDPLSPPQPSRSQLALRHELARKKFYKRAYLLVDPTNQAPLVVDGVHYSEIPSGTNQYSNLLGLFFVFTEAEANGFTIREYGIFGGGVQYRPGITSDYASGGVYHAANNPSGQVWWPGILYEVRHIPDFVKLSDTRFEIVVVLKT